MVKWERSIEVRERWRERWRDGGKNEKIQRGVKIDQFLGRRVKQNE